MKKSLFVLLIALGFVACNNNKSLNQNANKQEVKTISITAAGATFPQPFYNLAFKTYTKKYGTLLTYGGIGSGGGIRSLKDKVVDFGATDAYLSKSKEATMPASIVHIPTCIGAVVIAFNLDGVTKLKLSNKNLEEIFMGVITNWNDSKLKSLNANINLPAIPITVVHRSDGSGTTNIFSDYMCKISPQWEAKVGRGKSLNWPIGIGAKGNPGVAGTIKQTKGAIGYIGSEFAFAQKITYASVENSSGNFIKPNMQSISAAAQGEIPDDTKIMLTNSSDANAYPISGFTWLILYKEQNYNGRTKRQAFETVKFIKWIINKDAQNLAQLVNYAPLPKKAIEKALQNLKSITYNDEILLSNQETIKK